jgi:hypothetical protein
MDNTKKVNPKEKEPMKIYDKDMYKSQEKINKVILIITIFIIGFISGYACQYNTIKRLNNNIKELQEQQK